MSLLPLITQNTFSLFHTCHNNAHWFIMSLMLPLKLRMSPSACNAATKEQFCFEMPDTSCRAHQLSVCQCLSMKFFFDLCSCGSSFWMCLLPHSSGQHCCGRVAEKVARCACDVLLHILYTQWRRHIAVFTCTHTFPRALICMRATDTIGRPHFHSQFHLDSWPSALSAALHRSSSLTLCYWVIYGHAVILITAFSPAAVNPVPFYDSRQCRVCEARLFKHFCGPDQVSSKNNLRLNYKHGAVWDLIMRCYKHRFVTSKHISTYVFHLVCVS